MKNSSKQYLLLIAVIFVTFMIGVLIGRVSDPSTPLFPGKPASENEYTNDTDATTNHQQVHNKININTATKEELMLLPGIGEELSKRIIDYRTENGSFKSVEDLINVKGIGNKNLERIKDYLTIGE